MNDWIDPNVKVTPRHCDPGKFGLSIPGGGWQPFRARLAQVVCACGHTQHCAVGVLPGKGEEDREDTAQALLELLETGPCLSCRPSKARDLWGKRSSNVEEGTGASPAPGQSSKAATGVVPSSPTAQLAKAWARAEEAEQALAAHLSEPKPEHWSRRQPKNGKPKRADRGARGGRRGAQS